MAFIVTDMGDIIDKFNSLDGKFTYKGGKLVTTL